MRNAAQNTQKQHTKTEIRIIIVLAEWIPYTKLA